MKRINYLNLYIYRVVLSSIFFIFTIMLYFIFRYGFNLIPDPNGLLIYIIFEILIFLILIFAILKLIIKARISNNQVYIGKIVNVISNFSGIRLIIRINYNNQIIEKKSERLFLLTTNRLTANFAHIIGNDVECYIHKKRIYVKKVLF